MTATRKNIGAPEAVVSRELVPNIGPHSQGVNAAGLVFTSGQIAIDPVHSNLLRSLEYRHINTLPLTGNKQNADQLNIAFGVIF